MDEFIMCQSFVERMPFETKVGRWRFSPEFYGALSSIGKMEINDDRPWFMGAPAFVENVPAGLGFVVDVIQTWEQVPSYEDWYLFGGHRHC